MQKILGPKTLTLHTLRNSKFYIFGEEHQDYKDKENVRCLTENNNIDNQPPIHIQKFLNKIFSTSTRPIDFYLESDFYLKEEEKDTVRDEEIFKTENLDLVNLINEYKNCIKKTDKCKFKKLRVHAVDIRHSRYMPNLEFIRNIKVLRDSDIDSLERNLTLLKENIFSIHKNENKIFNKILKNINKIEDVNIRGKLFLNFIDRTHDYDFVLNETEYIKHLFNESFREFSFLVNILQHGTYLRDEHIRLSDKRELIKTIQKGFYRCFFMLSFLNKKKIDISDVSLDNFNFQKNPKIINGDADFYYTENQLEDVENEALEGSEIRKNFLNSTKSIFETLQKEINKINTKEMEEKNHDETKEQPTQKSVFNLKRNTLVGNLLVRFCDFYGNILSEDLKNLSIPMDLSLSTIISLIIEAYRHLQTKQNRQKLFQTKTQILEFLYDIHLTFLLLNTFSMDLYTVSRMLRKFDLKDGEIHLQTPESVIFYGGDIHADNIRNLLKSIGFNEKVFKTEKTNLGKAPGCIIIEDETFF